MPLWDGEERARKVCSDVLCVSREEEEFGR